MPARECFIAATLGPVAGPCDGFMQRAHLIPRQLIRRELGLTKRQAKARKVRGRRRENGVVWDPRVWRPMCQKHHAMLDFSKKVRLRREHIPAETEEYAEEHGLTWRLDRDYGLPA